MEIDALNSRTGSNKNSKLEATYLQFEALLRELRKKDLPDELVEAINKDIKELNTIQDSDAGLRKAIKKKQAGIIKSIEKDLKLVPKNHYRNQWIAVGMAAFGVPLGVAFGVSLGNMAFLGIGLPIGLAIGIAVGMGMDKKALEEGRQLDVEI